MSWREKLLDAIRSGSGDVRAAAEQARADEQAAQARQDTEQAMAAGTSAERVALVIAQIPGHAYGTTQFDSDAGRALLALPLAAQRDAVEWILRELLRLSDLSEPTGPSLPDLADVEEMPAPWEPGLPVAPPPDPVNDPQPAWMQISPLTELLRRLLRRKLDFDEATLTRVFELACAAASQPYVHMGSQYGPANGLINQAQATLAGIPASGTLREQLTTFADQLDGEWAPIADKRARQKLLAIVDGQDKQAAGFQPGDPWGQALADTAASLTGAEQQAARALLDLAASTGTATKPSKPFLAARDKVTSKHPEAAARALAELLLAAAALPVNAERGQMPPDTGNLVRALVWAADGLPGADLAFALGSLAVSAWRKVPGQGPLSKKVATAAVAALGASPDGGAQLGRVLVQVKQPAARDGVQDAIRVAADRAGIPMAEFAERTVPDFELVDGYRQDVIDDLASMATIRVDDRGKAHLGWMSATGKPIKSVPGEVRKEAPERLAALRREVKDLQTMLDAQRLRLERLLIDEKSWPVAAWRERYADHGLVGPLARRLLWRADGGTIAYHDGTWQTLAGDPVDPDAVGEITIWHPVGALASEVQAWRRQLEAWEVQQPFKQAHREVYLLTDAERTTGTYSNRFAAHVLRQHQMAALARSRGWEYALQGAWDTPDEHARLDLPAHGLRAVFFTQRPYDGDDWNDTGVYNHILTDQVRFELRRSPEHDPRLVTLEDVPPRVLSEVLRDVDLLVGVCSIGNDPEWTDHGQRDYNDYWRTYSFGELGASAEVRRDVLSRLLPKLTIADRASLDGRFLRVQGELRTYKIHLGSGNILMEPNDQYLCIVPAGKGADDVMLPFAGDRGLALVLSKALMLADDTRIDDPTIVSQINGP